MGLLCFALVASSLFSFNQSTAYANDDITGITLETEMRAFNRFRCLVRGWKR